MIALAPRLDAKTANDGNAIGSNDNIAGGFWGGFNGRGDVNDVAAYIPTIVLVIGVIAIWTITRRLRQRIEYLERKIIELPAVQALGNVDEARKVEQQSREGFAPIIGSYAKQPIREASAATSQIPPAVSTSSKSLDQAGASSPPSRVWNALSTPPMPPKPPMPPMPPTPVVVAPRAEPEPASPDDFAESVSDYNDLLRGTLSRAAFDEFFGPEDGLYALKFDANGVVLADADDDSLILGMRMGNNVAVFPSYKFASNYSTRYSARAGVPEDIQRLYDLGAGDRLEVVRAACLTKTPDGAHEIVRGLLSGFS